MNVRREKANMKEPDMSASTESTSIRVLMLSDSHITRSALKSIIESQKGIELIAEESLAKITTSVEHLLVRRPDVILFDLDPNSVAETVDIQRFEKLAQHAHIVALCDLRNGKAAKELMTIGGTSVVLKSQPPAVLVAAIHSFETPVDGGSGQREAKEMAGSIQREGGHCSRSEAMDRLTASEREIVRLVALGLRNKEVADRLRVSDITIRHHLTNIFKKLHVPNRQSLLILAHKEHLGTSAA
jgi:DNA-binding NarL/FixJ family response regulator